MFVFEDMFHCFVNGHLFDTRDFQGFHLDGVLDKPEIILFLKFYIFLRL